MEESHSVSAQRRRGEASNDTDACSIVVLLESSSRAIACTSFGSAGGPILPS